MASAGYRVWAPDQRGYNLSDKPDGVAAYTLDELAVDVIGLIDAANQQPDSALFYINKSLAVRQSLNESENILLSQTLKEQVLSRKAAKK